MNKPNSSSLPSAENHQQGSKEEGSQRLSFLKKKRKSVLLGLTKLLPYNSSYGLKDPLSFQNQLALQLRDLSLRNAALFVECKLTKFLEQTALLWLCSSFSILYCMSVRASIRKLFLFFSSHTCTSGGNGQISFLQPNIFALWERRTGCKFWKL